MKILLGVPEYPPYHVGGGGEVFKNLAEQYKKLGHDVIVVYGYYPTSSWNEDIKEFTNDAGIKFYQIPEIPYPKSMPFLRTVMPPNFKAWRKLKTIIEREKPDVAHLHGYGFIFINQLAMKLAQKRIPYIYTLHGAPVSPAKVRGLILLAYSLYKQYASSTLKKAKKITAVSRFTISFPEFREYKNIIVINNGINIEEYKSLRNQQNIYSDYLFHRERGSIIFLSLGRIEWLKGFQHIIEIIPDLKKRGFDIRYFIAGKDNGYKKNLDALIVELNLQNHVVFLGQLNITEKLNAIKNCDYVIVPSYVENFPAVPLEAMAMGKIPIASNIGGTQEIIEDGENGVLFPLGKKIKSCEKIAHLLGNISLQSEIRKNLSGVQKYNWIYIANYYLNIFQNE